MCVLKAANVDWVVALSWNTPPCSWTFPPVAFSMQLPVASETQCTFPTSPLVFVGTVFTPLIYSTVGRSIANIYN